MQMAFVCLTIQDHVVGYLWSPILLLHVACETTSPSTAKTQEGSLTNGLFWFSISEEKIEKPLTHLTSLGGCIALCGILLHDLVWCSHSWPLLQCGLRLVEFWLHRTMSFTSFSLLSLVMFKASWQHLYFLLPLLYKYLHIYITPSQIFYSFTPLFFALWSPFLSFNFFYHIFYFYFSLTPPLFLIDITPHRYWDAFICNAGVCL